MKNAEEVLLRSAEAETDPETEDPEVADIEPFCGLLPLLLLLLVLLLLLLDDALVGLDEEFVHSNGAVTFTPGV